MIYNNIQAGFSLWKDELVTVTEKGVTNYSSGGNSYYCFSYDETKKIISTNPIDHLEPEQR